jgi:hypothetical protein
VKEFFMLLKLGWENRAYRKKLTKVETKRLGEFSWYRSLRRAVERAYRYKNPYLVARSARRKIKLPESDLVFGETPFITAFDLLTELGVDQADHVVECGGGTSIFSLVANCAFGCPATVLEIVPGFVKKTREITSNLGLERVTVRQADILEATLPEGTVYYLTGTTFCGESWKKLQRQMANAPVGSKAISLSVELDPKAWRLDKTLKLPYSWGENTVYLQTRI